MAGSHDPKNCDHVVTRTFHPIPGRTWFWRFMNRMNGPVYYELEDRTVWPRIKRRLYLTAIPLIVTGIGWLTTSLLLALMPGPIPQAFWSRGPSPWPGVSWVQYTAVYHAVWIAQSWIGYAVLGSFLLFLFGGVMWGLMIDFSNEVKAKRILFHWHA